MINKDFKINFIVYSPFPEYISHIGGATVPHTLADKLQKQGENVYLYSNNTNSKYNVTCIPWGSNIDYDPRNTVVIFIAGAGEHTWEYNVPEVLKNAPNIVRWLVNDQVKLYPPDNKFYTFHKYWNVLPEQKVDGALSVIEVDHDLFKNKGLPRQGTCYQIKGNLDTEQERIIHKSEDFCIDPLLQSLPSNQKMEFLSEVFNKHEYFINYTPFSFASNLAALCGCKSIIIPKKEYGGKPFDKEKFKDGIYFANVGIALGMDDLPRLESEMDQALPKMKYFEETISPNQINTLINDCYNWLQEKYNLNLENQS
jgi:hypothetical protein